MPTYWYNFQDTVEKEDDDEETKRIKAFNQKIVASNKPYFMTYVYPTLKTKNNKYLSKIGESVYIKFFRKYGIKDVNELIEYEPKTEEMIEFIRFYNKFSKTGNHPCTINRMCWIAEDEFSGCTHVRDFGKPFDISILKSGVTYSKNEYNKIYELYCDYRKTIEVILKKRWYENDNMDIDVDRTIALNSFRSQAEQICTNEDELCDIIVDMCYRSEASKPFAWDVVGNIILRNLLKRNRNIIHFPVSTDSNGEFEFCGRNFVMCEKVVDYE